MKNKSWKFYLSITVISILAIGLGYLGYNKFASRDFKEIKSSGVLRIATEYNSIGFFVSGDSLSGFQYELSELLQKRFGIRVETYPVMSLKESMQGLSQKKFDIIARPIPVTTDLKEHYLFTSPILYHKQVLVQRKKGMGKPSVLLRNQVNLIKRTIYISKNSPALLRIRNLSNEIGDTIYVKEDEKYSDEQLIAMVAKGSIDYAVCDQPLARKMVRLFPEIDIETDISFTQFQSWMVRKDSKALLDSINIWLAEIKKSKKFQELYLKYY